MPSARRSPRSSPSAMGAKKRVAEKSISPPKKAKVLTEEEKALNEMLDAFSPGAVGTMLTPNVVNMVKEVAEKCLLPPVENRDPLETKFAEAVGAALDSAMQGLEKAHSDQNDLVADEEKKVQDLENALTEANTMKEKSDESLQSANEAETEATAKKLEAETTLAGHVEEEKGLQPKKATMEGELQGLREVQEIARGPADPSKKDVTKVQKALRQVEAPEALILGIGAAIGKQTPMDQHFVNEASKLLYDKSTKLEGELETFNETVEEYAKKTRTMTETVEQLRTDEMARMEEQAKAKQHQKECVAAVKEAEKQKKAGDKSLEKTVFNRDLALQAEELGKATKAHYTFLFERSIAVAEEPVVSPEKAASPAASSPVAAVPSAVAAPEAAMEVEPVA